MTKLLIRLFIRGKDPKNAKTRTAYGNLAGVVGILCNVLLFAGKFLAGTLFGSIAIQADAVNNLSDASSNVVSLIGFKLGSKVPDEKHPYGHARYEYFAGLCVSVMILVIGCSLLKESFLKVLSPSPVAFSWLSVGVLSVSIAVKLWMSLFNKTVGTIIHSDTLLATAADSRNDCISTAAVLAATFLCRVTGIAVIDGVMGLAVAVFILYSGIMLVRDTISPLLGESPSAELVEHIEKKALSYPGVLGVHDLMVHDYGPGRQFATLHLEFPAEANVLEMHDVIDNVERDFMRDDNLMVTIHYDPIVTADAAVSELRVFLSEEAKKLDPAFTIHDLRIVPGPTHTNILFDLVVPAGYTGDRGKVLAAMRAAAHAKDPNYFCVIKVEQNYTGAHA